MSSDDRQVAVLVYNVKADYTSYFEGQMAFYFIPGAAPPWAQRKLVGNVISDPRPHPLVTFAFV